MSPISESGRHGEGGFPDRAARRPHPGWPNPGGPHPAQLPAQPDQPPARRRVVVVVVDGSADSGEALRRAASQARQRNALLDIVHVAPAGTEGAACILARVKLGEFTRRECPYGTGVPVRLRVECGDPLMVLSLVAAEAELLINGLLKPPAAAGGPQAAPAVPAAAPRHRRWARALIPDLSA